MENSTSTLQRLIQLPPSSSSSSSSSSTADATARSNGNAFPHYILIVMSFYGFFLCAIMLGYFRSKRREERRVNVFTKLVHDKEKQEWGALPKKHSVPFSPSAGTASSSSSSTAGLTSLTLPFCSGLQGHPSPLACALCTEQSSVSSLCSTADTRVAIEEEEDSGTAEEAEEAGKGSGDDSG